MQGYIISQHLLASLMISNIHTYNNVERLLRQLESQGEAINGQKMLIYQILSKFPVDVVVKLEDAKKCEVEWTMELLRKLLTEYIITQECAQRRVANAKGRVYTQDSEQINYIRDDLCTVTLSDFQRNQVKVIDKCSRRHLLTHLPLMFGEEVVGGYVVCFVKVIITMMSVRNLRCSVSVNRV